MSSLRVYTVANKQGGKLPSCVAKSTVSRNQPLKAQGLRDLGHYSAYRYNWLFSAHRVFRYGGKEVIRGELMDSTDITSDSMVSNVLYEGARF